MKALFVYLLALPFIVYLKFTKKDVSRHLAEWNADGDTRFQML